LFGSKNFFPKSLNNSVIPILVLAEVRRKAAPILSANSVASFLGTSSSSNLSHLFPASPKTK